MKPDPATASRPFLPSWLRWHDWLTALGTWLNSSRWETGYVVLLLGFVLVYQLASPIVLGDTDMWYHLNGGRYFWENGAPANHPFFSFNDPERPWVNYYWGFQAIVYKVHELAGYQGLVVLRSVLVFASLLAIWSVIVGFRGKDSSGLALLVLLALYVILVDGRAYQLRPHLFSYAFIPFFIYVLEHRPRWAFLLPVATVAWVNLHGVEWVVGALIGGAYLLEFLVQRRRGRAEANKNWWYAVGIMACVPALLLNPNGPSVLVAPFAHPTDLTLYVSEMRPLSWAALSTFVAQSGQFGAQSAFALLFAMAVYAAMSSLIAHRPRMSHLLLLIGGLVLLSRGTRFIWEWALLALPLLGYQAATLHSGPPGRHTVSPSRVIGLVLLVMPLITLGTKIDTSKPYPFDDEGLPVGTTTFLREREATGNLLMNPSLAGYAQWMLGPRIRVFADMELPPFNDWDMYRIFSANRSAEAFKRIVDEYPIDFILVELRSRPMASFIKEANNFAPVFFDDSAVLYAHRQRQAALVSKYELRAVNPFSLLTESNLFDEKRLLDERLLELEIVQDLFPAGNRALHALTRLLVDAKRYPEAEKWADRFLEAHPRDPNSQLLKGVILENTDRCPEAIVHFQNAFPFSGKDFHPALHQHLGTCHYMSKEFTDAFEHFSEGVNVYLRHEPSETLYQYAFSAVIAGDAARARLLLKAILYQTPEKEELVRNRARGLLAQLDSDPSLSEGFLGSLLR